MGALLQGGCLCGRVRFSATEPPQRTLACHCTFCQRLTGSAFYAEAIFRRDAVRFGDGEIGRYDHISDTSGRRVHVHFCPRCATTLGLTFERWPGIRAVSRGCFDTPGAIQIDAHIWTRSAQTGIVLPADVPRYETSPFVESRHAL